MATPKKAAPCPICGKPESAATRPFCSKRCANLDLGRWLKGDYRIPTEEQPETPQDRQDKEGEDEGG